jgi:hypothetical protein
MTDARSISNRTSPVPTQVTAGLVLALLTGLSMAAERQHGTHVHGEARLDVAVFDQTLQIEMRAPAMSLVGFGHEPSTPKQKQRLETTLEQLEQAESAIALPAQASCQLEHATAKRESSHNDHNPGQNKAHQEDHPHDTHDSEHSKHSEIIASYSFHCAHADQLTRIEVLLSQRYPALEKIKVQLITETKQDAFSLTGQKNEIEW